MIKNDQRGIFGGWAEGIIFVVAILGVLAYLYSKYPAQFKEYLSGIKKSYPISASQAQHPSGLYSMQKPADWYVRIVDGPVGSDVKSMIISSYDELKAPNLPSERAKIEISAVENPKNLSGEEWLKQIHAAAQDPMDVVSQENVSLAGQTAYKVVINPLRAAGEPEQFISLFYLPYQGKMYEIWAGGAVSFQKTADQILSTFRFTK